MTFDEVLAKIIDLLKRQGRVSYGALKRRFDLDDDYLKDLKEELLYVYPVREDEGRGLVWTGDTATGTVIATASYVSSRLAGLWACSGSLFSVHVRSHLIQNRGWSARLACLVIGCLGATCLSI